MMHGMVESALRSCDTRGENSQQSGMQRSKVRDMTSCRFGPYFVSPVIAGLELDGSVYLAGTDSIGAIETAKDFMVSGTAPESLMGVCEAMWRPGLVRKRSVID
jgi:20S proteasome alpha/beta subunit